MRKLLIIIGIICYIFILMWIIDFAVLTIFDLKIILGIGFGTIVFAVLSSKDNDTNFQKLNQVKWSAQGTALIVTLLLLMQLNTDSDVQMTAAMSIRPLFYGVIIFISIELLQRLKQRKAVLQSSELTKDLTRRELEVFALVIKGYSNQAIANELYIAESTVKKHMKSILKKTQCENREVLKTLASSDTDN